MCHCNETLSHSDVFSGFDGGFYVTEVVDRQLQMLRQHGIYFSIYRVRWTFDFI